MLEAIALVILVAHSPKQAEIVHVCEGVTIIQEIMNPDPIDTRFIERIEAIEKNQEDYLTSRQPSISDWEVFNPADLTFSDSATVTYSGATLGKFHKGDRIRITQGGTTKYFFVTYNSGVNDVVIFGGDDYTFTSDTITEFSRSSHPTPAGYPDQFSYNSGTTFTNLGGVTLVTNRIDMQAVGNQLTINMKFDTTTLPASVNQVYMTLPTTQFSSSITSVGWVSGVTMTNGEPYTVDLKSVSLVPVIMIEGVNNFTSGTFDVKTQIVHNL